MTKLFILVDDDPLNNLLLKKTIEKNCAGSDVKDFVEPELALSYIEYEFGEKSSENKITLFLDINMPTLTGWDFLEEFEKFPPSCKKSIQNLYSFIIHRPC
jgi:CheY-like chemotaxis protein